VVLLSGLLLEGVELEEAGVVLLSGLLLEGVELEEAGVVLLSGLLLEGVELEEAGVVLLSGYVEFILLILSVQLEFTPIRALVIILVIQSAV
jgi:hypothetical protein